MGPPFPSNWPSVYLLLKILRKICLDAFEFKANSRYPRVLFFALTKTQGLKKPGSRFSKLPITFRARKAILCLPCLHPISKFQSFWKWYNETISQRSKIDWFVSYELCYYSAGLDCKIWIRYWKVNGPFEKQAPGTSLQTFEDNEPQHPYTYRLFLQHHKRCCVSDISSCLITIVTISIDFLNFFRRFELPNGETLFQWKSEVFNYDQLYTGWNPTFVGHLHLIRTKAAFNIVIHSKQWIKCGELSHHQMVRLPGHLDCFIFFMQDIHYSNYKELPKKKQTNLTKGVKCLLAIFHKRFLIYFS